MNLRASTWAVVSTRTDDIVNGPEDDLIGYFTRDDAIRAWRALQRLPSYAGQGPVRFVRVTFNVEESIDDS